ncbi:MAG: endonuclease domain-containing protein [Lewinellaceae bacterium]|nr:endonuclease domain-containing protein [Lewinellaceae bacterium]
MLFPSVPSPSGRVREGLFSPPLGGTGGAGYQTADPIAYGRLKEFAKQQKDNPTDAEKALWQNLRNKALEGYKFRRQHIIDRFIADFICLKQRLIIEVDGGIHQLPDVKWNDEARTLRLNELGFHVLRFTNEEVLGNMEGVLKSILAALVASPQPPPKEGELGSAPATGEEFRFGTPSPLGRAGEGLTAATPPPPSEGSGGWGLTT